MQRLIQNIKGDRIIWLIILLLSFFSILAVYSSTTTLAYKYKGGNTEFYLFRHAFLMCTGLGLMYLIHRIDYRIFSRIANVALMVTIPLLLVTLIFGENINDANRWVRIPVIGLTFQPSDLAKLTLTMYLARTLSKGQYKENDFVDNFIVRQVVPIGVVCFFIAIADLSTAAMIFMTSVILLFVGRTPIKYLLRLAGSLFIFLTFFFMIVMNHETFGLSGVGRISTWNHRIEAFFSGSQDVEGNFQSVQAKIAIGTSGLFGKGPNDSTQKEFLPHPYSDYIYAIVIEEYGLIGGSFLLFLYLLFLFRCIRIVMRAPKAFGALLAVGLSFNLVIQALLNMAVTVNLLPVTGLPLPMVSWGGTSIWFTSISIGLILSVSRNIEEQTKSTSKV